MCYDALSASWSVQAWFGKKFNGHKLESRDLRMVFLDLTNAFGCTSVPHQLLWMGFWFAKIPSGLSAFVWRVWVTKAEFTGSWQHVEIGMMADCNSTSTFCNDSGGSHSVTVMHGRWRKATGRRAVSSPPGQERTISSLNHEENSSVIHFHLCYTPTRLNYNSVCCLKLLYINIHKLQTFVRSSESCNYTTVTLNNLHVSSERCQTKASVGKVSDTDLTGPVCVKTVENTHKECKKKLPKTAQKTTRSLYLITP